MHITKQSDDGETLIKYYCRLLKDMRRDCNCNEKG